MIDVVLFTDVHEDPPQSGYRTFTTGQQHARVECSFEIPVAVGFWLVSFHLKLQRLRMRIFA